MASILYAVLPLLLGLALSGAAARPALPADGGPRSDAPAVGGQLGLGRVRVISAPASCDGTCVYELEVTCPELRQPARVDLQVGEPVGEPRQGTIVFATGHFGEYYWTGREETARILVDLRGAGFRTVELKWPEPWFKSAPGEPAGLLRLGCRPATVARWAYDNLYSREPNGAFCATGRSNGAAQVTYMLTHYGLGPILSLVVLESGPSFTRLDAGCLQQDPATRALWFSRDDRRSVDFAFGYADGAGGPCFRQDVSFRDRLRKESLHFADGVYVYPKTMVWFLFGGSDTSTARAQGELFYRDLRSRKTPMLRRTVVPKAPHGVFKVPIGADILRSVLLTECVPR